MECFNKRIKHYIQRNTKLLPFTDNPQFFMYSAVSELLCLSSSDIINTPSSKKLFPLTFNDLNVVLPVMITVDITNQ